MSRALLIVVFALVICKSSLLYDCGLTILMWRVGLLRAMRTVFVNIRR